MLIRSPNSFNKKEKELRAFTHWLIKVEVSRRALITRARDPIGEGSDRPFNVSTRGGGRRGGGEWRARPFMSVPYLEPEPRDFLSPVTGTKKERVDPRLHYGQPMGVNTTVAALKD